jgi:hypothetical protein
MMSSDRNEDGKMKRVAGRIAALLTGAGAALLIVPSSPGGTEWRCLAAPVHGQTVRAGPFVGQIVPRYDVVGGRFRLHVGIYRNRAIGLSQKIPWFVPVKSGVGSDLTISFKRLVPLPARRFTVRSQTGGDFPNGRVFPTAFVPPTPGCWRITFRSGAATGSLVALVSGDG